MSEGGDTEDVFQRQFRLVREEVATWPEWMRRLYQIQEHASEARHDTRRGKSCLADIAKMLGCYTPTNQTSEGSTLNRVVVDEWQDIKDAALEDEDGPLVGEVSPRD